eukprot:gene14201-biopygen12075
MDHRRARLSTEGKLYLCLFASQGHDLRPLIRGGATDEQLAGAIAAIWQGRSDRYSELRASLPDGADPKMGAISTGLGEIYMWSIDFVPSDKGFYVTPEGDRLTSDIARAAYLRTVQDWIVKPQLRTVKGVTEINTIGGYAKEFQVSPMPERLVAH